jgi:hypothetical protein
MQAIATYNVDAKLFAWTYTGDPLRVIVLSGRYTCAASRKY